MFSCGDRFRSQGGGCGSRPTARQAMAVGSGSLRGKKRGSFSTHPAPCEGGRWPAHLQEVGGKGVGQTVEQAVGGGVEHFSLDADAVSDAELPGRTHAGPVAAPGAATSSRRIRNYSRHRSRSRRGRQSGPHGRRLDRRYKRSCNRHRGYVEYYSLDASDDPSEVREGPGRPTSSRRIRNHSRHRSRSRRGRRSGNYGRRSGRRYSRNPTRHCSYGEYYSLDACDESRPRSRSRQGSYGRGRGRNHVEAAEATTTAAASLEGGSGHGLELETAVDTGAMLAAAAKPVQVIAAATPMAPAREAASPRCQRASYQNRSPPIVVPTVGGAVSRPDGEGMQLIKEGGGKGPRP